MFDLGFNVDACFFEGAWFLFFIDGSGGLWSNGVFYIGHKIDEKGN